MKNLLYSMLFLFPLLASAQVTDNFSDGDFINNPTWNGDQAQFIVNTSGQLQLSSSGENISFLSTPLILSDSNEWNIWIKLAFSPSDNNNLRYYLVSDQTNLKGSLNGYYLQIGENLSLDAIELYRQSGNTSTLICRGTDGLVSAPFAIRIRVTLSAIGLWKIFTDATGGQNFQMETSGTDNTYNTSGWFGIYCKYTSSNSTKFYFDDIYAGPVIVDVIPPQVTTVSAVSESFLNVKFSESIESASASDIANYSAAPGIGQPLSATPDLTDNTIVHLVFTQPFTSGTIYTLSIDGVRDLAGNSMQHSEHQFAYYKASAYDILINEIMADPDPPVSLPNFEYVELYNRSNYPINLEGWSLFLGSSEKNLSEITMQAGSYLILANETARQSLGSYGPFIGFSSFTVTNTSGNIKLLDADSRMIHNVSYSEDWYRDNYKKLGGWSLEQIDPMNPCGDAGNWKASSDISGGTPGKQNSIFAANPDLVQPMIQRVTVDDSVTLTV
ncbi:MAG: lamin tail domain-containing protein, partial [Bacteroidota bacterium]